MARLPDASNDVPLRRMAVVRGRLAVGPTTAATLGKEGAEWLASGKVAALGAAKRAGLDVPTALPVQLTDAFCDLTVQEGAVECTMTVQAMARQTLEAHALAGCAAALLAVWDACRSLEQAADGSYPHARLHDLHVVQNVVL